MDEDGALDARGESLRPVPVRRPDTPRRLQAGRCIRKIRQNPSDRIIIASAKAPVRSIPALPEKPHTHGCRQQPDLRDGVLDRSRRRARARAVAGDQRGGSLRPRVPWHGEILQGPSFRKSTAHSGLQTGRDSPIPRAVLRIQVQHSKRAGDASSKSRRGCPRRPGCVFQCLLLIEGDHAGGDEAGLAVGQLNLIPAALFHSEDRVHGARGGRPRFWRSWTASRAGSRSVHA